MPVIRISLAGNCTTSLMGLRLPSRMTRPPWWITHSAISRSEVCAATGMKRNTKQTENNSRSAGFLRACPDKMPCSRSRARWKPADRLLFSVCFVFLFIPLTLLSPLPVDNRSWPRTRVFSAFENYFTIDDDVLNPSCILVRFLERGVVNDRIGIENCHIRPLPRTQQATVVDANFRGVGRCHLPHGLFEGNQFLFAHIAAQHARESAVITRMRMSGCQRPFGFDSGTVRPYGDERLFERIAHILFRVVEVNSRNRATIFYK